MQTRPELVVIREMLEGALAPEVAAAVLFTALDRAGQEDPEGAAAWLAFTRGPLREALVERAGHETAEDVIGRVEGILDRGTPQKKRPRPRRQSRSELPTGRFMISDGPTRALIVATSGRLARVLKGALGPRVVPMVLGDLRRMTTMLEDFVPTLVIIDLTDAPALAQSMVVAELGRLDDQVLTILWCNEVDEATELQRAIEHSGRRTMRLSRGHGVDPLLDLIRASQH